jgi:hypothetical protein
MKSAACFRRIVSLENEAAARLEAQGYEVFRPKRVNLHGNIFAARKDQGLLINLMRLEEPCTGPEEVTKRYNRLIRRLRKIPCPKECHFEIWVYACATGTWQYYRIEKDRVIEVKYAG